MKRHKAFEITSFKALPDADGVRGRFEAVVSVFGNVDYQGDRVIKGAFAKSLEKWRKTGDPIPIIWSHDWGDPFAHIGSADPALAEETDQGLKLIGNFDIEKPFAAQVYDLVKTRRVREWSFAYDIEDEAQNPDDKANELRVLDIIEAGPTLKGANPDTQTLGVKSALESAARKETPSAGTVTVSIVADTTEFEKQLTEIEERLSRLGFARAPAPADDDGTKSRKNVYTYLPGSDEEAREEISVAVQAWADGAYPPDAEGDHVYAYIAGTFSDHVVVELDSRDEERRYFEIPYTRAADGVVTLGTPTEVEVVAIVEAKNSEAWLKAEFDFHVNTKEFDDGAWDGGAAMSSASSAADFRKIAFERDNDSDPDTAAHWALPHHISPGAPPNAKGVSAALGALSGARGGAPDLKNAGAARSHLEAHSNAIAAERDAGKGESGDNGKNEIDNIRAKLRALTEG